MVLLRLCMCLITARTVNGHTICDGGIVDASYLIRFPPDCKVVDGDLIFQDHSFDVADNMSSNCMASVATVKGRLVYEGITRHSSSPCLSGLKEISHLTRGPAIELRRNKGLTSLRLEKLVKIRNKDEVVFRVIQDKFLEQTSEYELQSLVKAAGGNQSNCRDLFFVWQQYGEAPDTEESNLVFFVIYGIISVIIYVSIILAHFVIKVHIPPHMRRGKVSMKSLRSVKNLKSLKSVTNLKSRSSSSQRQAKSSSSLPSIAKAHQSDP